MAKLLRVSDKLLLGLALVHDLLDEFRVGFGLVGSAYRQLYGFVPSKYKKQNLYATVNRMLRADLIEKTVVKGEPRFRLSSLGRKRLSREFPLLEWQNKRWDRRWRVLVFDIAEEKREVRDRLRAKLKELGFGMIQKSVWLSPHPFEDDMREYLLSIGLRKQAYLFLSDSSFFGEIESLVEKLWQPSRLNRRYQKLVSEFQKGEIKKRSFIWRYLDLVSQDPYLPQELLPRPWYGQKARVIFKDLVRKT